MKLSEYVEEIRQNKDYIEAERRLQFRFRLANAVLRGRMHKGLSQGELADIVGTKQANISRIEAGLANPTLDFILRICEALNIDLKFMGKEESDVEPIVLPKESKAETTYATMPSDSIRIDDQPDNLFCHPFKMSPISSTTKEGELK